MQINVQQDATKRFLKVMGLWCENEVEAMSFSSRTSAMLFCIRHYLSGVHLLVKYEDGRYERH